ncbi:ATP-dependent DNA helicase 2 subunit KU80 isoform X3 [Canna indica]|uniref:ATP-dependent DNA helicase 2 subunit KU80 isoform X3 n=1 Tax=Canna indica TaxID=4628 RepID=A0AAQ3K100_9LILI|nr:ATP-dependent DNA helicase 2 subunit KU80 isoform X3 [Canna indica]
MARNKETLILLIDVGPSMHSVLPEVENVCSMLVQKKLIFGKTHEVAVVLFGTEDTHNDLEKEVGGYEHVVVLREIGVVDGDLVELLQNLPRGTSPGDFLDAIVVGIDMLLKKSPSGKQKKCLYLITDAKCSTKDPFEGTKEDQVWVYKKTSEEKFPTLKKYSDKAHPSANYATHEVKVGIEYKSTKDPDKFVPPEQRIKGYSYGPQVIPISSAEWDAVKFKPEKGVKLLGFTDASNILRHYYMKDVYIFIPEPGNAKATVAVSAIARGMKEMNKCAILRCVWRQGQGNVVIGLLTPNLSSVDNIPDSFYFNVLPFAEDVREFQFPSFSNFPSCQPDEQQQEVADDLVRMLDLAPSDTKEVLQADFTANPVLERFYRFLDLKSKNPEVDVPQLDRRLKRIAEPDPETFSRHKPIIDNFQKQFELKENPKKKKLTRRAWREKASASNEEEVGVNDGVPEVHSASLVKCSTSAKVEKVSDLNPVQDFEAMMARRDSSKWTRKAIKDMQDYIIDLLENSFDGNSYPKAIECLIALRKGCILEQEPKEFNQFLINMYKKWNTSDLADFLGLLPSKNITLISKSEAADSDLTEEEARNFPVKLEDSFE